MYVNTNITEQVIAELLFVDQATVSRALSELEGMVADVLGEFVPDLADEIDGRVPVVDGSVCPCWSWFQAPPELYSGKHHTAGHAHQLVCDLDGALMHISDPLPGNTHDAKAVEQLRLSSILRPDNSIGDKAYLGTTVTAPFRTPTHGELLDWQKEFSTTINGIPYVIERVIANFTTWRCRICWLATCLPRR